MAEPVVVTFVLDGNPLKGSVAYISKTGTAEVFQFNHEVTFIETRMFTEAIVREHKDIVLVKPVDASSVSLYQTLTRGTPFDKVIIEWFRVNEKNNKREVYFRHTLQKPKISRIRLSMPNIKDTSKERHPHLEEIHLRYDRIVWQYMQGNIEFTDRWDYGIFYFGMNKNVQEEYKAVMGDEPAATDELVDNEQQEEIKVTNPRWEHVDETLKKDSPEKSLAGYTIKLFADIQGYAEKGKVTFDIYDISKDVPQRLDTVYGKNEAGISTAEWKVEDPRKENDTFELKLAFEASARSKYSKRKEIAVEGIEFEYSY